MQFFVGVAFGIVLGIVGTLFFITLAQMLQITNHCEVCGTEKLQYSSNPKQDYCPSGHK